MTLSMAAKRAVEVAPAVGYKSGVVSLVYPNFDSEAVPATAHLSTEEQQNPDICMLWQLDFLAVGILVRW